MSLARKIAVVVAGTALPSLLLGLGCSDKISGYPPPVHGEPNGGTNSGGTTGTGGSHGTTTTTTTTSSDLCPCAVNLATGPCVTCNKSVLGSGGKCTPYEQQCAGSAACVMDADCVAGCLKDAGNPEPMCVGACIAKATTAYVTYVGCVCNNCAAVCVLDAGETCSSSSDAGDG